MPDETPEPQRAKLAGLLKLLRVNAGLTTGALAERLEWSQSKVSKTELGRTRPSPDDVRAWAAATHADREQIEAAVEWATQMLTHARTWRGSNLTTRQHDIAALEAASASIRNFQAIVIPGLLQVPEYAQQILAMAKRVPVEDVADTVAARMARQSVLFAPGKTFHFILGESALLWQPAFADAQEAQADRLLTMEARPNITLSIIPFGGRWPLFMAPSFTLFDIPGDPVALREDGIGDDVSHDPEILEAFELRFEDAASVAITGEPARELIRATAGL